jgi:hypothetical protein
MILKMQQVIEFHTVYSKIKEQEMPVKLAYRLNQIEEICEKKANFYEITMRDIIARYSEKDNEGNPVFLEGNNSVKIKPEFINECTEKIQELSELEVELPDISFTLDSLEALKLSALEVKALMHFIKEEE